MASIPIVNETDRKKAIAAALAVMILLFLYLELAHFYMADPPPQPVVLKTETTLEQIELKNLVVETGGAGSGTPSDDPVSEPKPQTQQVLTKKDNPDTKVNSGKSRHNSAPNSQNTSSTTEQSTNPFGTGGSGGKTGTGTGGKFGNDSGPSGKGPAGSGNGEGRIRMNNLDDTGIEVPRDVTVNLILTIDENGNVISARSTSKTTTTDQRIINQVKTLVKSQIHYSKDPGSGLVEVYYTVLINAN